MKIAVVGATGLVGQKMIQVLEERKFEVSEFIPVASSRSVGKEIIFNKESYKIRSVEEAISMKPSIAIFSAGGEASKKYAPMFSDNGTTVIDNSSAWRMFPHIKLVVPEVNAHVLTAEDRIISNPNCSTIQLVVALAPLHRRYKIRRIVISTYQSVTGTGVKAVQQLEAERKGISVEKAYPHAIHNNCIPHGGSFLENLYTTEEEKLVSETRKILSDESLRITSTVVRIPVTGGHSESVNLEFEYPYDLFDIHQILSVTPGITIIDDPANCRYPMPILSENKDDVFVGRIRRDESIENGLNLWIVSDNLRKGAATNAVQIAEYLVSHGLVR